MEYQKKINLLDNKPNQASTCRTKNWVKKKDNLDGTYNTNSQIKFKTSMLKPRLCHYSDAYILVNVIITITVDGNDAAARRDDERDKGVIFKNCAPFADCINGINNTQVDNERDLDVVMPMYNLVACSYNYSKTF